MNCQECFACVIRQHEQLLEAENKRLKDIIEEAKKVIGFHRSFYDCDNWMEEYGTTIKDLYEEDRSDRYEETE